MFLRNSRIASELWVKCCEKAAIVFPSKTFLLTSDDRASSCVRKGNLMSVPLKNLCVLSLDKSQSNIP
uniref:Uncharacterized protein n=1 Tax=Anguilla anguilla TaxID=7936 RepID=A0A0E9XTU0_ANGAN